MRENVAERIRKIVQTSAVTERRFGSHARERPRDPLNRVQGSELGASVERNERRTGLCFILSYLGDGSADTCVRWLRRWQSNNCEAEKRLPKCGAQ